MTEIIVGVDGSAQSAEALRWALRAAEVRSVDLVAVLVWDLFNQRHADGSRRFDPDYDKAAADEALDAFITDTLGPVAGAGVIRRPVCDVPAPGLLAAAGGAELLVVGARGLGGFRGLLLGSISQQVVHHARVPVAVVRGPLIARAEGSHDARRVVVGVDGSEGSAAALRWALADAAADPARLEVVHSWEPPVLFGPIAAGAVVPYDVEAIEAAGEQLVDGMVADAAPLAPGVQVERRVVAGGAARSLIDAAKGADLVVVGRRGQGGFSRLLLGSVSDHVVRHAESPVVVVPSRGPTAE